MYTYFLYNVYTSEFITILRQKKILRILTINMKIVKSNISNTFTIYLMIEV